MALGFIKTDSFTFETNENIEELSKHLSRLQNIEKSLSIAIGRVPRKGVFGEKKLSRAFCDFQGSTRFIVGFSDKKGKRPTMEDEIVIMGMGPRCRNNEDYFAVFDGHGGTDASTYAATTLHERIDKYLCTNGGDVIKALVQAFHDTHSVMCNNKGMICGTCALVTYIKGNNMYIANLGDSRVVIGCRGNCGFAITKDHKPELPEEIERITALGGFVQPPNKGSAVHRVMGKIAVSRALGSRNMKPYVSHDPDVYQLVLSDDDYFLILACDGIWDVISDQDAADVVFASKDPQTAASKLSNLALQRGSADNISVISIFLKDRNKWTIDDQFYLMKSNPEQFLVYADGQYLTNQYNTSSVVLKIPREEKPKKLSSESLISMATSSSLILPEIQPHNTDQLPSPRVIEKPSLRDSAKRQRDSAKRPHLVVTDPLRQHRKVTDKSLNTESNPRSNVRDSAKRQRDSAKKQRDSAKRPLLVVTDSPKQPPRKASSTAETTSKTNLVVTDSPRLQPRKAVSDKSAAEKTNSKSNLAVSDSPNKPPRKASSTSSTTTETSPKTTLVVSDSPRLQTKKVSAEKIPSETSSKRPTLIVTESPKTKPRKASNTLDTTSKPSSLSVEALPPRKTSGGEISTKTQPSNHLSSGSKPAAKRSNTQKLNRAKIVRPKVDNSTYSTLPLEPKQKNRKLRASSQAATSSVQSRASTELITDFHKNK